MMKKLELFFLKRYMQAPKRNLFRFSFVFMVLGIVLSVAILSAGLHLFQGYESSLKKLLLDSFAHIGISSATGSMLSNEQCEIACQKIKALEDVESCLPLLTHPIMAQHEDKIRAASIRAYQKSDHPPYRKYITSGRDIENATEIVAGHYLLEELGLGLGDSIQLNYPRLDQITPMGIPSALQNFEIVGIYRSGYYENDRSMLITGLQDARDLLMIPDSFSKLELRLKDPNDAQRLSQSIVDLLGIEYMAIPWNYYAQSLLSLVAMEKWLIFIVFSFLVLIAGINVISTVTTIIADKKQEIAVLKTIGAKSSSIRRLFSYRVGMVGIFSIVAGQILGVLLSWIVENQSLYRLKGDVYFIDTLKMSITLPNLAVIFIVASLLVFLCIMIPLKRIEKMQIINILRNQN
jgi:lipoprotein-releasing system permease protein